MIRSTRLSILLKLGKSCIYIETCSLYPVSVKLMLAFLKGNDLETLFFILMNLLTKVLRNCRYIPTMQLDSSRSYTKIC